MRASPVLIVGLLREVMLLASVVVLPSFRHIGCVLLCCICPVIAVLLFDLSKYSCGNSILNIMSYACFRHLCIAVYQYSFTFVQP